MKRKRLNRDDGWGFQYYPYYQMRLDLPEFHGLACLIRLTDGLPSYWETPRAGQVQVTGAGMTWLELIPDGANRVLTVMYPPAGTQETGQTACSTADHPPYRPSVFYADITEGSGVDEDGVAWFLDKYLDVIFTPEGDVKVDDRDELDQALAAGELSGNQAASALAECDGILRDWCADIGKTMRWCADIRQAAEGRIAHGEPPTLCRETAELRRLRPICSVQPEELAVCAGLIRESFLTVAEAFGITRENAPRFTAFATTEEKLRYQMVEEHCSFRACYDEQGRMLGCYALACPETEKGVYELRHLCVRPEERHAHIGAMLLQDALMQAREQGGQTMRLSLVEENRVLKTWYERFGFHSTGTEKFDFFPFTCDYMERGL